MEPPSSPSVTLPLRTQCLILGDVTRIAILRELAKGEPLPVSEFARRLHRPRNTIAKHLTLLKKTGIAVQGFGRLYLLAPAIAPPPGTETLNLGDLTLRLTAP